MLHSLLKFTESPYFTSFRRLFFLVALCFSPSLMAQEVFTIQAVITLDGQPNLNSTLIILENENTEVASQNQPVLMLSATAKKTAENTIKLSPKLQALNQSGIKQVPLKAFTLSVGESKQGQIDVPKLGELQWSFQFQTQTQLKQEIPSCFYKEC